ncbi:MAG: V-type ATP synthase subunit A [Bacteroides sp.]|nr:V-type ATP synthase subunit A [Eubacterium sp.]MCM1419157.1 V-type ATP synthase subunit A [Roseburia sp.]MCM1463054.1 V-type ATP synthase subunit A [Bacteroides sp.]
MNTIHAINGPVIKLSGTKDFAMREMVYVGEKKLIGEVIGVNDADTVIQVYENTAGLTVGERVEGTGGPMTITLGPGIISEIFDGIARPLRAMLKTDGSFVSEGSALPTLDEERVFDVTILVKPGDRLTAGAIYATCPESSLIVHKMTIPPDYPPSTVVSAAADGGYRVNDVVVTVRDDDGKEHGLTLCQKWAIRSPRPVKRRIPINTPLLTGQRVLDTIVPIAKGGTAAIPGGFGTGKTMTQHQIAKWCDADIIVYIGCGERGNEMTQVLEEFSELIDPKSGKPLTDRTVLIANTSNMPVAAREASIYTGITIAEYYRDMGYDIAIMADSTSRWAEALREISGRLEEMPAEEGFPAYLPSRLSEFYERAANAETLSGKRGSVTIIGAVSPQGSDFSEPVTQNTKRFVRCFLALDKALAYARHYPAINWLTSYSEYIDDFKEYYEKNVGEEFYPARQEIANLLLEENQLMEIVKLIGADVLPDDQKLVIETAKVIRVGFLQQNAFHKDDTYVPLKKQLAMMKLILRLYQKALAAIGRGVTFSRIAETDLFDRLTKMKYEIPNDAPERFAEYERYIDETLEALDTVVE